MRIGFSHGGGEHKSGWRPQLWEALGVTWLARYPHRVRKVEMTALQETHQHPRSAAVHCDGPSLASVLATLGLAAAGTIALGPSGAVAAPACSSVPSPIPLARLVQSGTKMKVHVGAIVYAVLAEPERYATGLSHPTGFPWASPRSSQPKVLRTVRLCQPTTGSSLPTMVAAFRASRAGTAVVSAPLGVSWRAVKSGPRPFRAVVTVVR